MKPFKLFRKKTDKAPEKDGAKATAEMEMYAGMRVEVTGMDGRFLFIAKLAGMRGDTAQLHLRSETAFTPEEPLPVKIRGYSDAEKKAVYFQGVAMPESDSLWRASQLTIDEIKNARAFFRLATNLDASLTPFGRFSAEEMPCKLLNISVGGAGISTKECFHKGDKMLLRVRLLADAPESVIFCQVLRAEEKESGLFEYGCQFLGLTEDDQEKITKNIFAAQRQKRARS